MLSESCYLQPQKGFTPILDKYQDEASILLPSFFYKRIYIIIINLVKI